MLRQHTVGAMSVILTNAKTQACYRECHLGVEGEKVHVAFNLIAGASAKMNRPRTPHWLYNNLSRRGTGRASGKGKAAPRALKRYYNAEGVGYSITTSASPESCP
jgi:hypothetical protein